MALIFTCNEKLFAKLSRTDALVIEHFRKQLTQAGLSHKLASQFFGLNQKSLLIISPFGTRIEYSTLKKNIKSRHVKTFYKTNTKSRFGSYHFEEVRVFDHQKLVSSFLVNFIHSCDSSILQQLVK